MPVNKRKVWEQLLDKHDKLRKRAGATIYERVTILKRVYEETQFKEDMQAEGKSPEQELSSRVTDTCANAIELFHMLKMFPNRSEWESGNLSLMKIKVLKEIKYNQPKDKRSSNSKKTDESSKNSTGTKTRDSATLHQVKELKLEVVSKQTEVEHLRQQLVQANQIIRTLEAQVESYRVTIGSLNEAISVMKMERNKQTVS